MRYFGSGYRWHELDAIPYLDMEFMIICINAAHSSEAAAGHKNVIYSQLGVVQAGAAFR